MELGIWNGGSVAFWYECLKPVKHVAIDYLPTQDTPYFKKYIQSERLENSIKTYWGTDQADRSKLLEICSREFDGPLDLVIDDASHFYHETKASFETFFPLLRPGGFYVIEDWAWAFAKERQQPNHPYRGKIPLSRLVVEITSVTGSSKGLISSVSGFLRFCCCRAWASGCIRER